MKNILFRGKVWLSVLLMLFCVSLFGAAKTASNLQPGQLELIGRLTAKALERNHLRKLPQNAMLSARIFDEYIKMLDPGKVYFTKQDIALFSKDRTRLLSLINQGELQVIFSIYRRYLERIGQYRAFVEKNIKEGISFDSNEVYRTNRKEEPYCRNDLELGELWRKRLKNDLLYYRLMQKVMEERANDPEVKADLKKRWFKKSPEEKVRIRMHDLYNHVAQSDQMDILGIFLTAMAQVYGPHSHYSTPKQEEDFDIQFKLSLTGIGATLTNEDGYVKVVDLVPGGPADKDGRLQPEDRIIAVTQEQGEPVDIIDMSVNNAVKLIRGPAGTRVTLTVLPAAKGASALPEDITILRAKVELKENEASGELRKVKAADGTEKRIGVIKLNNFYMDFEGAARGDANYRSCTRDIRKILQKFQQDKVDAVILDLRSNSGGSLVEAISLSGLFITRGPIVQVVDALNRKDVQFDPDEGIAYGGPLVLLVSKFSASSAEILTGAMKDYRRAVVVGDSRTYGKGTVLSVTDLSRLLRFVSHNLEAGSLTHEMAMFFRVNGDSNQERGIKSDIVLPSFTEVMEVGEKYSENHLPWRKINAAAFDRKGFTGYQPLTAELIAQLNESSQQRVKKSGEWKRMQRDIERFKTVRERKDVSLNEKKRLKEYYDEKAATDRMEKIMESGENGKKKTGKDILLNEALNIAGELQTLLQSGR